MDRSEFLNTFLATKEPADRAAQDADLCLRFMETRSSLDERQVRVRLMNIEIEQGLGPTDLEDAWNTVGLERGWPQPPA